MSSNTNNGSVQLRKIPDTARSKRLKEAGVSVSGGGVAGGGGTPGAHTHNIGDVVQLRAELEKRFLKSDVLRLDDIDTEPIEENVLSAKRSVIEDEKRLRRDIEDTAAEKITFAKGVEFGQYSPGALGSGGNVEVDENGSSSMTIDKLTVRKETTFNVLNIHSLKASGGEVLHSEADIKCTRVEELANYYRCYFDSDEGTIFNEYRVDDQARCQKFDGKNLKYYWRLVVGVGADYIDLSKTICDGSSIPSKGDDIIQLGNRTDKTRQSAILISVYSSNSPSITQYDGIDSFSLEGKEVNVIGRESKFSGKVTFAAGSSGYHNIEGLQEEIDAAKDFATDLVNGISIGSVNVLMNSGFTGDYTPEKLTGDQKLTGTTQLYSNQLKYWIHSGTVKAIDKPQAVSTCAVSLDGELAQAVNYIAGDNYIASFRATGASLKVNDTSVPITAIDSRYTVPIVTNGNMFKLSGNAVVYDLKLERGTIATDWSPNPNDNPSTLDKFNAINYITQAIEAGNTEILGGLILSSMIQLGLWKDGKLDKVMCGLSGIANEADDPAFWAGGDLAAAFRAILDPSDPTGAAAVITHGGLSIMNNAIIRGIIYAVGGKFTGDIESNLDGNRIVISAKDRDLKMIDARGNITARLSFMTDEVGTFPTLRMYNYGTDGNYYGALNITPTAINMQNIGSDGKAYYMLISPAKGGNGFSINGDFPNAENAFPGQMYVEDTGGNGFLQVRIKK